MRFLFLLLISNLFSSAFALSTDFFSLTSPSFQNNSTLPTLYTCDGKDIQPALAWENVPEKTKSFVIILSDPDAPNGTFYHWVLYNIPASLHTIPEVSEPPKGAEIGKNSWDKAKYNGPCPPKGSAHHYVFTIYALDENLSLTSAADANTVLNAMQTHVLGQASLTSSFGRE